MCDGVGGGRGAVISRPIPLHLSEMVLQLVVIDQGLWCLTELIAFAVFDLADPYLKVHLCSCICKTAISKLV